MVLNERGAAPLGDLQGHPFGHNSCVHLCVHGYDLFIYKHEAIFHASYIHNEFSENETIVYGGEDCPLFCLASFQDLVPNSCHWQQGGSWCLSQPHSHLCPLS